MALSHALTKRFAFLKAQWLQYVESSWNVMAHGDAPVREVKGKPANGVGSQYSHTTSELGVSSITTADARNSAASSRLNWRPRPFKWARPFRRKTKSGFCARAITFQTQSTWKDSAAVIILNRRSHLCFVDRASLYTYNLLNRTNLVHNFNIFIAFLYMFRATMCPSSGENTVPMRHRPAFQTIIYIEWQIPGVA